MRKFISFALVMLCISIMGFAPNHQRNWRVGNYISGEDDYGKLIRIEYATIQEYTGFYDENRNTELYTIFAITDEFIQILIYKNSRKCKHRDYIIDFTDFTGNVAITTGRHGDISYKKYEFYLRGGFLFRSKYNNRAYEKVINFLKDADGKDVSITMWKRGSMRHTGRFTFKNNGFIEAYNKIK